MLLISQIVTSKNIKMDIQLIQNKIYEIRGQRVMLDFDLAELYEVETRRLKEQVRRNINRFPTDFMFELNKDEYNSLRSQFATLENGRGQHSKYLPFAFTEQGVAMLASVLHSQKAIEINIQIVRAFVVLREYALGFAELNTKLESFMIETNMQFNDIYQALTEMASQKELDEKPRNPIGFK
jgi:phage regulator Rha-like protein